MKEWLYQMGWKLRRGFRRQKPVETVNVNVKVDVAAATQPPTVMVCELADRWTMSLDEVKRTVAAHPHLCLDGGSNFCYEEADCFKCNLGSLSSACVEVKLSLVESIENAEWMERETKLAEKEQKAKDAARKRSIAAAKARGEAMK